MNSTYIEILIIPKNINDLNSLLHRVTKRAISVLKIVVFYLIILSCRPPLKNVYN